MIDMSFDEYIAKLPRFVLPGAEAGNIKMVCPLCDKNVKAKVQNLLGKRYAGMHTVKCGSCDKTWLAVEA